MPDDVIDVGDLAIVSSSLIVDVERRGRGVGQMRIVEVGPAEEPLAAIPLEPGRQGGEDGPGVALRAEALQRFRALDVVIVKVEAPGEAEPRIQREGRHERRGPVAARFERPASVGRLGTQGIGPVVPHEMVQRIGPRHDRAMRRQGQGDLGISVGEPDPFGGQPVQVGRPGPGVTVAPETVGPYGIDGDQEDVEVPAAGAPRTGRRSGQRQDQGRVSAERTHRSSPALF